ncbi:MAG: bis(5'-nucleosyl)-tetraphosphatase (symmetrical) YqeK [Clostridia bacterium]|nr:bis(5'-nucleosyl)-tetraphosphatase (symmetrical) YqeK [Clostridia bacterium]
MMKYDWNFIKKTVKGYQKEKRYLHTEGVSKEAKALARLFLPQKEDKLYLAGLLHDITKDYCKEEHLNMCNEFGIAVPNGIAPKLLHAKTGAAFAQKLFGREYVDDEVYGAIYYHTTGRENMTLFEMLIYLADYIEEGRTFEDCVVLRKFFYDNIASAKTYNDKLEVLRKTMIFSFDLTIKNLILEEKLIDNDTINARNYFLTCKLVQKEI